MKFHVLQNDEIINSYNIDVFGDTPDEKVIGALRRMWRDMCAWRDDADCLVRLKVQGEIDGDGKNEVALGLNLLEFTKHMGYMANAYIPKAEGSAAIKAIFDKNCLSWPKTLNCIQETGKIVPFLPSSNGIFSFHFYEPDEWARYSMTTIAGAANFVPFEIQDYSVICKSITECPAKARPMVWVNPSIVEAFISMQDSDVSMETMQTYLSSFIIVAGLESGGDIDDMMATQLWAAMRNFAEDGDTFALKDLYNSAEKLLQARK